MIIIMIIKPLLNHDNGDNDETIEYNLCSKAEFGSWRKAKSRQPKLPPNILSTLEEEGKLTMLTMTMITKTMLAMLTMLTIMMIIQEGIVEEEDSDA